MKREVIETRIKEAIAKYGISEVSKIIDYIDFHERVVISESEIKLVGEKINNDKKPATE